MADWLLTDVQIRACRIVSWTPDTLKGCQIDLRQLLLAQAKALVEEYEKPCTRHIVPSVGGRHPARRFDCPYCMLQLKQEVNDPHT